MPEGPEVRCISDNMRSEIKGNTLLSIHFFSNSKVYENKKMYSSDYEINYELDEDVYIFDCNEICINTTSYGKKICILFSSFFIISSLNMEGRWSLKRHKDSCICMNFNNGCNLYFRDVEKRADFSIVNYNSASVKHIMKNVGNDIQDDDVTIEYFIEQINRKKYINKKLCDVLLDQSFVSGIGNYLRSEIIYHAKIRPDIRLSDLSPDQINELFNSIKYIMRKSYILGGLTLSTYTNLYDEPGKYKPLVFMRCTSLDIGLPVAIMLCSAKRKVYYCPSLN
jgi:endonuclease-8